MKRGFYMTAIGAVCWGFSGTCGQFLFSNYQVSPLWLTSVRMMSAGLILSIISLGMYKDTLKSILSDKGDLLRVFLFALIGLAFSQFTYLTAINYSNAATATVLQYLYPVLIMLMMCLKDQRLPRIVELLCVFLAIGGTFVLATHGNIHSMSLSRLGLFWGILSAVAGVCYTMTPVTLMDKHGSIPVVGLGMLVGGCITTFGMRTWRLYRGLDQSGFIALVGICFVGTVVGYAMYLYGVKEIGAMKASMLASIEPLSAAICSFAWLHVSLKWIDIIGFLMIMATVFILAIKKENQRSS